VSNLSKKFVRLGLAGLASAAVAGILLAQVQDDKSRAGQVIRPQPPKDKDDANQRIVEGVVSTAGDAPVEGAIVQLKDTRTLTIRSFRTQADGKYRFAALRTDTDYELKAILGENSSDTKRVSSFDNRKAVTINLALAKK
jgi:hypothetical protein